MAEPAQWLQDKIAEHYAKSDGGSRRPTIDLSKPSVARVYDYLLGGQNNFEVDRLAADMLNKKYNGGATEVCVTNRRALQRAVRYLAGEAGIRQFIDIGSGLPTQQNVHEIAHEIDPAARVVYVDKDPIVLAHGRALLADNRTTSVAQADAVNPDSILDAADTRALIDLDQPWAVLMASVLHHLTDEDDPAGVTRRLIERMPSGSYLFTVNLLREDHPQAGAELEAEVVSQVGSGYMRTWDQIRRYYDGLEWVDPGLVYANDWRPTDPDRVGGPWATVMVAGMGHKR
ncbi:SAM-dependent methyltransferase [Pseudonocardia alaniniphila]|uniref:SAM-dependent methyltransferase n=1 Tax=Pseudonocardia alaniniphila TaxID=75291 RepID=A0ABS9TTX6_9PSEU|nr:SAM-dependent methyltransferase [Pseudonocardia alaniniphila]MCH6171979.1 SAM-dependent methyltransferase [Pseudonocardia alaniniphila]